MYARRKKDEVDAILAEFFLHYREKKRHCRCKSVASLETQPMPTKFKSINENVEVLYVAQ